MGIQDQRLLAWIADGYKHKLFASEPKKEDTILPCDGDSFALLPEDTCNTYAELGSLHQSLCRNNFESGAQCRTGQATPQRDPERLPRVLDTLARTHSKICQVRGHPRLEFHDRRVLRHELAVRGQADLVPEP